MDYLTGQRLQIIGWTLIAASLIVLAQSLWIPIKARIAQSLLQSAWQRTIETGVPQRPWPWADHYPIARLQAPRLGIDQIVLAGDSGAVMAFAPGESMTARSVKHGARVISAHRDTHFRFLQKLAAGDELELVDQDGATRFMVVSTNIVDSSSTTIDPSRVPEGLILVTCYPFDALSAGGDQRFVVVAERLSAST